jgi:hypothetical protein
MKIITLGLLMTGILLAPTAVRACGCDDDSPGIVHFKDGLTPNGAPGDCGCGCKYGAAYGDASSYGDHFQYRDYGPSHAAPPPAPYVPPKQPTS